MSGNERPLPKPTHTTKDILTADKIAMAMAEGRLEEFIEKELQGGEHARALTMMMLGMTGMAPAGITPQSSVNADAGPGETAQGCDQPEGKTPAEQEIIDRMIEIARENNITLDWLIMRALRVYIREYRETGRL